MEIMGTRSKNIVGEQYGRLTVVSQWVTRDTKGRPSSRCRCECDCGGTWEGLANSLRTGATRSCGCLNDEVRRSGTNRAGKPHSEETKRRISEAKAGKYNPDAVRKSVEARRGVPLSEERRQNISASLRGRTLSEDHRRKMADAKRGKRFKRKKRRILSDEQRRKQSVTMKAKGEKCPLYKDGRGAERHASRTIEMGSVEYKIWRDAVYRRDDYTCVSCGERGGRLNADHIRPWSSNPELRYSVDNGRTLCVACHRKTPTYGRSREKAKRPES